MDNHTIENQLRAEEAQRRYWAEDCPYGDYLNAVDNHLEELVGRTSVQSELGFIADMQEIMCLPEETAWAIAKESFSKPWKLWSGSLI